MLALAVPSDADLCRPGLAEPGGAGTWPPQLLAAGHAAGAEDLTLSLLVRGTVGPGPGVEFLSWLAEADLPDPESVLADPDSFVLPGRGDRGASRADFDSRGRGGPNRTPARWAAAWRVFGRAGQTAPDARRSGSADPGPFAVPLVHRSPPEVHMFAPLLRDAQLLD